MATVFFLLRHAAHGLVDQVLCGRMPGVRLGAEGHAQARRLAARMAREELSAIQTSPLERCLETAGHLSERLGLQPDPAPALQEIDMGAWTGRRFAELEGDPSWQAWNAARDTARAPGGESMAEAQARTLTHLESQRRRHPGGRLALVSHADIIKAVVAHLLGLPLQAYGRFDIAPGSVSAVVLWEGGGKLLGLNEIPAA